MSFVSFADSLVNGLLARFHQSLATFARFGDSSRRE